MSVTIGKTFTARLIQLVFVAVGCVAIYIGIRVIVKDEASIGYFGGVGAAYSGWQAYLVGVSFFGMGVLAVVWGLSKSLASSLDEGSEE